VQLGVALGFLVPLIVPSVTSTNTTALGNTSDINEDVYDANLGLLYYISTGVTGILFIIVLFGKMKSLMVNKFAVQFLISNLDTQQAPINSPKAITNCSFDFQ
jgi:hypothetical protein